ncbi:unnamed protein product [Moneuplotes crassus]|uniref:Uncharacterized protein n=1 Tax=Euplotes crassus TaxID=5936 RepID=A0AAD1XVK4_EUPCR|nr:unnamed protein product [Moneuplotes crassus]
MEGKTKTLFVGEFGAKINFQIDHRSAMTSLKNHLLREDFTISKEDKLMLLDLDECKEIRESSIEDSGSKIVVFNQSYATVEDIKELYLSKYFKIHELTLEEAKDKNILDEIMEDKWNFKPLLSLKEDIDIPKVQQFEEHMFQIYNACLDSFISLRSKQDWSRKAMEEIKLQEICSNLLRNYSNSLKESIQEDSSKQLVDQFKSTIQRCNEILIKFEAANRHNKETLLHDALQREGMTYLSDIYIKEQEMIKFRDARREDLKKVKDQVKAFEETIESCDANQSLSSLDLGDEEMGEAASLQEHSSSIQDLFYATWSIVSGMGMDIKMFHKNLNIMESITSTDDDKYEAQIFLSNYESHQNKLDQYMELKSTMEEHHQKMDNFIESCKQMQIGNAEKIVRMVEKLVSKTANSISYKTQKLIVNCKDLEKSCKYLLRTADLPEIHEKIVKEFGRRYCFEHYLRPKEKQLSRMIASENSKRHKFITEVGESLPENPLTSLLKSDRINMKIERSQDVPLVTDVETEEIQILQEEMDKELKQEKKMSILQDEMKLLKAQLRLKEQEIIQLRNQKSEEFEKMNTINEGNLLKYKNLVSDIVDDRRSAIEKATEVIKAPIVLEYFEGNLQDSQDVIMGLKNTISNKNETIDNLENKIVGLNQVITSLTSTNFAMMSAKVSTQEAKVKHYEDLYKQEMRDKKQLEDNYKEVEIQKLRAEKDHKKLLDSYTEALKESRYYKLKYQKAAQEKIDKKVLEDYERKIKKVKIEKESCENSMKDLMAQNSLLRSSNQTLCIEVDKLKKENEESLRTYIELANQSIDQNISKDDEQFKKLKKEREEALAEKNELNTVITDLQLEISEYKEQNGNLLHKLQESYSQNNTSPSPLISMSLTPDVTVGELKVGDRRIFIRDYDSDFPRYIPLIFSSQSEDESFIGSSPKRKILKQKLPQKIYLDTESIKTNLQTLLHKFKMIVVGEVSAIEEIYCEEAIDEYSVAEGETYTSCTIKSISCLGYVKNNEYEFFLFPDAE